jgi:hypothetical protein
MNIPDSMKDELGAWNNGQGIDLASWISCSGSFSLAVGYVTIFCPKFIEFEDYIFQSDEPVDEQFIENIRSFESREGSTPASVERVINHLHIADLQYRGCEDISPDKLVILGIALKETYEARLSYFFPNKPCAVEFYIPDNPENYDDYQLSFWQKKHEENA